MITKLNELEIDLLKLRDEIAEMNDSFTKSSPAQMNATLPKEQATNGVAHADNILKYSTEILSKAKILKQTIVRQYPDVA